MDKFELLREYKHLKDDGVISDEEFAQKKKELLKQEANVDVKNKEFSRQMPELHKDNIKQVIEKFIGKLLSMEKKKKIISICLICVVFVGGGVLIKHNSGVSTSSDTGTTTASDKGYSDIVIQNALYEYIQEHFSDADAGSCTYSITQSEEENGYIYVYGKVTLYDKYGYTTGGYSDGSGSAYRSFEVKVKDYKAVQCTIK